MNLKLLFFITLLAGSVFCQAQKRKKIKFEDEKIALQFFLDSIYPFRPLIKDKVLVSEGDIIESPYRNFFYTIPFYRDIIELTKLEEEGVIKTHSKERNGMRIYQRKGRFSPSKYGIKKRSDPWFTNRRDSTVAFLEMSSMYYDSTKQENLVNILITRTNLRESHQWYIVFCYGIVIKNKKVKYWAIRETY
ncbi:hypothetical protein [Aureispira anguillae]|uniref:Uncharacterized protein n=1 Tax=Aureispira anguillae TaxID=2864201 RepID=A0A915YLB6_9BACT|nr:hypothetical protein [Aureispira anguillae]BDS15329.1 hypothetical protein AsAng_0061130 [Aureispira anguillae]